MADTSYITKPLRSASSLAEHPHFLEPLAERHPTCMSGGEPTVNRRKVFSMGTSLAALAMASTSAGAHGILKTTLRPVFDEPSLDTELTELGAKLDVLAPKLELAYARSKICHEEHKAAQKPFPDVLRVNPADQEVFNLPSANDKWHPGYYTTFNLWDLKRHGVFQVIEIPVEEYFRTYREEAEQDFAILYPKKDVVRKSIPWPEAQQRLDEIVSAIERWKEEDDRIADSLGSEQIEQEIEILQDQQSDLFDAILSRPAKTLEGLMVKARAVKVIHEEDTIEFSESTDVQLAASALNDLLAMAEPAAPAGLKLVLKSDPGDENLFDFCSRWHKALSIAKADTSETMDSWNAVSALTEQIVATPALTNAGLRAKARAANAFHPDGWDRQVLTESLLKDMAC